MKTFITLAILFSITVAEPPPSNSYLPPPPSQRSSGGYSSGGYSAAGNGLPQVVSARNQGNVPHGAIPQGNVPRGVTPQGTGSGNGYSNGPQGFGAQGQNQGYDQNAAGLGRNTLEQQNSEPANYNFEYMVNDFEEGTDFGHQEERFDSSARGEYHVVLPDGRKQTVSYEADERGFKPRISYEESDTFARSGAGGYDANSNRVDQSGARGGNTGNGGRNGY